MFYNPFVTDLLLRADLANRQAKLEEMRIHEAMKKRAEREREKERAMALTVRDLNNIMNDIMVMASDVFINNKEDHKDNKNTITNDIADSIDHIIFNAPATVVFWKDGDKSVVRCHEDDTYDPVTGLAMACLKKSIGDKYNTILKETVVLFKYMLSDENWNATNVNKKLQELATDLDNGMVDESYVEPVLLNLLLNRDGTASVTPKWFDQVVYPDRFASIINSIIINDGDTNESKSDKSTDKKEPTKKSSTTKSKTSESKKTTTRKPRSTNTKKD